MTDVLKILGQVNPSATTLTALYTVPAATAVSSSTFTVCNQSASAGTFRISVAAAGAADTTKQYIFYDAPIGGNDTFTATIGMTLATTDLVRVYASNASMSFNIFGVEVS